MQEEEQKPESVDPREKREVADILSELTIDHAARSAFARGANTLIVAEMVEDPDISQRLRRAFLDAFARTFEQNKNSGPE
ncbi:MAG TPA: hypothetical protein VFB08_11220 [Burkholderiales bacterium]|nr:hypothetical protein [Burkholderiales bacterium]